MKVKQCLLQFQNGDKIISWIDSKLAVVGNRGYLEDYISDNRPLVEIIEVWHTEKTEEEISEQEIKRRAFGGSIH